MNKETKRLILVTGATGRQGGAVVDCLVAHGGFQVRALSRTPEGTQAAQLIARGVEVVRGDLEDSESLKAAAKGAWGVFSVQDPWRHGVVAEIRQGMALADAACAAGVEHFVYTSVATAERLTNVPHFESKGVIEKYIDRVGLNYTVIRPTFFMDMLVRRSEPRAAQIWGMLRAALGKKRSIQLISVHDIGRVAVEAFAEPKAFARSVIELAADELTMPELDRLFSKVSDHKSARFAIPLKLVGLVNPEARINFDWIGREGWHVDIEATRKRFPWLASTATWLQQ